MRGLAKHSANVFFFFAFVWTVLLYFLYGLHIKEDEKALQHLAVSEARTHFDKDVLIRSWATSHGGVYVPPSASTPPNPHLSHLKERDIVTTEGKILTLVNPAYMTRQLHELANEKSGVRGHITSLHLTREENKPDAWEREALQAFEKGQKEVYAFDTTSGQKTLRYMGVLIAEEGCLKCHASYKVGDVRGGISVTLPLERYNFITAERRASNTMSYLGIWLFGLVGIVLSFAYLRYFMRQQASLEKKTLKLQMKEEFLHSISEGVYGVEQDGRLSFVNEAALALLGYEKEELLGKNPHELFHLSPLHVKEEIATVSILEKALEKGTSLSGKSFFYKKGGEGFPVEVRVSPVVQEGFIRGAVVLFRDITQEIQYEKELQFLATTDPLTHVNNRRTFEEWLHLHYSLYQRERVSSYMLMLDIDFFKRVNDTYGHQAGDDVLIYLASMVQDEVRQGDCFARIGGEEFALLLANTHKENAMNTAQRLRLSIERVSIPTCEGEVRITISIGISTFFPEDRDIEAIISRADDALYLSKQNGRNQVTIA